jgi:G3E family GTPase
MSGAKATPARYVMIGGFLGAGKTTALAQLARRLADRGRRVGLITNDQGHGLADTAMLASRGFPVEEIAGGCFCCRFSSLTEAARKLTAAARPDVFLAEPVGSCTDLVATVSYPLRRLYGEDYTVAPLSVLVDPVRARRLLGLAPGAAFSEKVRYIYRKQLEEADLIVINKRDLLADAEARVLRDRLHSEFQHAELLEISARRGDGMAEWLQRIEGGTAGRRPAMAVDYDVYAEGEALLGWLNATAQLTFPAPADGNAALRALAESLRQHLHAAGAEIAHLKMTLDPADGLGGLAVINVVRNDVVPELSQELSDPLERGELVINLRAEAAPETLRACLERSLGGRATLEHTEAFRPGRPTPEHRLAEA